MKRRADDGITLKRLALWLTDFRTALVAAAGIAAMFPGVWAWAAEVKADQPAIRETLQRVADQQAATQEQLDLLREMVLILHQQQPALEATASEDDDEGTPESTE